jgi:RNA polymerase sigma-70 factor, ECF subfamily
VSGPGGSRTDAQLLAAHVAGDAGAFETLVRRHQDRLWAVALRTLGDREEAADALQDALVSAYRRAGTFRGESAVTTWLHRVVVNACLDRVRRRSARPTSPLTERHEAADRRDDHASTETRLDVLAALATLPEHQRTALVLVDMQGMPVAEAAAVLDVAPGTVKSRCARGRAALAPLLAVSTSGAEAGPPPTPHEAGAGNRTAGADVPPASSPTTTTTDDHEGGRP